VAGKVSRPAAFRVRQQDVSQIPLVRQMSVTHGDADRQDLAHRLRVDHEVVRVRVGSGGVRYSRQAEQVGVVLLLLETPVQPLRSRPTSRTYTRGSVQTRNLGSHMDMHTRHRIHRPICTPSSGLITQAVLHVHRHRDRHTKSQTPLIALPPAGVGYKCHRPQTNPRDATRRTTPPIALHTQLDAECRKQATFDGRLLTTLGDSGCAVAKYI